MWLLLNCLGWLSSYFWEQIKAASHREAKRLVLLLARSNGHQQRVSVKTGLFFLLQNPTSEQRKSQGGKIAQLIVKCLPCKHNNLSWILRAYMKEEEETAAAGGVHLSSQCQGGGEHWGSLAANQPSLLVKFHNYRPCL